ncbi:MAG: bifunctional diaminohydroxyphosphoribosylaminopyrimidine deaminase/5-amino-6-(5-phosphoribosylamino)uracil reductase RibD [Phycisphaerae bacterium]|nr:bifunctional diaminohydroxyphosphoribosylaminopyrimidine deaminase/5-amino-6-(5-phosphoribosylamino)uracil reductase RibD [Phycisphaerae bacterium]
MSAERHDALLRHMKRAVRLAVRGHGRVEPNPMVGCVVLDAGGRDVGAGFHRRLGGEHAEVEALRRAGAAAKGGTLVVTLEPCSHHGRTPPCTDAIRAAGVARVFFAARDPNPAAAGGAEALRRAGIEATHLPCPLADELNAPFLRRTIDERPWVSAKWAQTIDGAIAAPSGESRWISSPRMRRAVHRERGRVDAILTGIGTVLIDDPQLTVRGVTARRTPIRVVVDPRLRLRADTKLARDAATGPAVVVAVRPDELEQRRDRREELEALGVRFVELPPEPGGLSAMLRALARDFGVHRVLVESGGGLLGAMVRESLIDECWVVLAPTIAGSASAPRAVRGLEPSAPASMHRRRLAGSWRRGDEMLLLYR